ncbi:ferredoxin [Streptomyces sp. NPDC020858]|uniref:ferredoxin n=1 Tax=Streptomyces sp. NPDC020858 TaxID=3365097 RepID=UPI0037B1D88B
MGHAGFTGYGRWSDRNWRNVPGPFYGASTDTMWHLLAEAPAHILCDDEDNSQGFVFRQPIDAAAVECVVRAAQLDCYLGFAHDGDQHWTVPEVRRWWRERRRIAEWINDVLPKWTADTGNPAAAAGLRAYAAYLGGELAEDLRLYAFWLDQRRSPTPEERLPEL